MKTLLKYINPQTGLRIAKDLYLHIAIISIFLLINNFSAYGQVVANFVPLPDSVGCHPFTVTFNNLSLGADTFYWNFGDGSPIDTTVNPVHTFINTFCTYDTTYIVCLIAIDSLGASDTLCKDIVVHPKPCISITQYIKKGCTPLINSITISASGADSLIIWDYGDGSYDTIPGVSDTTTLVHIYTNATDSAQNYILCITAINSYGCDSTVCRTIKVYPGVIAGFIPMPNDTGCHPFVVNFVNTTTGAGAYYWDFGDGSFSTDSVPTHTFVNYDTSGSIDSVYIVCLTATSINACTDTACSPIIVHPKPFANFTIDVDTFCSPYTVTITNLAAGYDSLFWDYGDATAGDTTTATTFTHLYQNTTDSTVTYDLCLIAETQYGCTDTLCLTIIVYPVISANFTFTPGSAGCHPFTVTFNNLSLGADFYAWDFGDGSPIDTTENPVHTFTNTSCIIDTIYTVCLIAIDTSGASDTLCKDIVVHPKPVANLTVDADTFCSPYTVTITNLSSCYDSLYWNYGDGSPIDTTTSGSFIHTYYNLTCDTAIYYNLCLIAESQYGCTDTFCHTIVVYPEISVEFAALPDTVGCHPFTVNFAVLTCGEDSLIWDFGDGNFDIPHQFNNSGTLADSLYTVELIGISNYGCPSDTAMQDILVHPKPIADFAVDVDTGCSPLTVTITNLAAGYDSLLWDFYDGNTDTITSATFMHTYINTTDSTVTYNLCLIAETQYGCTDTFCRAIVVYPEISADFVSLPAVGCHPLTVNFLNLSLGEDICGWNFGDGGSSTTCGNPVWTFTNTCFTGPDSTYIVELIVSSVFGCVSDTARDTILVYCKPVANFTVNADTGCVPFTAIITNLSTGYDSLYWDFGDGETDSIENPVHVYDSTGIYNITLILTNENCSDTATCLIVVDFCTGISQLQDAGYNLQVYPNPFSATANITISNISQRTKNVEFVIYDIMGRKIKTYIIKNNQTTLTINAKDIGTGLFFVQLIADEGIIASGKMIIVNE